MATIKVHILNFHKVTHSHIEILLEDCTNETVPRQSRDYYHMNRWSALEPMGYWQTWDSDDLKDGAPACISNASSVYTFEIEIDNPNDIAEAWQAYLENTKKDASILGNNCAAATQWFLKRFAQVPEPNLSNVSWNHLGLGLFWPSFLPFPVTLPGRIMSNAKFHIEARVKSRHPLKTKENMYHRLLLYTGMSAATLTLLGSMCAFALVVATSILSGGIAGAAMAGCVLIGLASTYCFFKARNHLSAKKISEEYRRSI